LAQETIVRVFWERVKTSPERPAVFHKVAGSFRPVIWREQGRVVELVAGGLIKLGVERQDKVAILSNSRPQWTWADLATLSAGAVTVPIYPTLAHPEIEYLLRHSDAVGLFVENDRQLKKLMSMPQLPAALKFIVLMEGEAPAPDQSGVRFLTWDDLLKDGEVYLPTHPDELPARLEKIAPEDLSTIVYTSGTTGVPKGVMLLHSNIFSVCQSMSHLVGFHPDDLALSFLPLSHVYERVGGQFLAIYEGLVMAYAESIETVAANMVEVRPTIMNGVPRFFEKVYHRIQSEVRHLPQAQQYLIRWALALGKRAAKYRESTGEVPDIVRKIYRAELRVAERLVYSRIRRRFGGRLRFMVSGAAPLSTEVQLFFDTIGLTIIEGYGLTETSAPATCNTPNGNKRGTVGRPVPGVDVKIAEDGEVMVRGPSVFAGYYKNEDATRAAFVDGWFLTGDIGELDQDGYLRIKDRKKDIIITANGKHVAPQFLENLFRGENLVSHILVYGDRRKFISALITLNHEGLASFAKTNSITYSSVEELYNHPLVLQELAAVVARKNQRLASFEQIKRYVILEHDFTVEANELTPTLKVKRRVVTEKYRHLLDGLYPAEDLEVEDAAGR